MRRIELHSRKHKLLQHKEDWKMEIEDMQMDFLPKEPDKFHPHFGMVGDYALLPMYA
ncbi:hypothetical protein D3C84_1056030 [compost metagenome]